jgi:N-[(2S)-2-amino-2-carboxyethyl]-L-glutamate dehydrogenase
MLYLNKNDIACIGLDWTALVNVINKATYALSLNEFSQPLKPYLRYRDLTNRIIAMPAFIGGDFEVAGIKWIASFPKNIQNKVDRAHAVVVLNEANTGIPFSIINTALISGIRTAAVSGAVLSNCLRKKGTNKKLTFGVLGLGPIGILHIKMLKALFNDTLNEILVYDVNPETISNIPVELKSITKVCRSWSEVFDSADVFITCTVSKEPYVNKQPRGKLYLNVSLRDFDNSFMKYVTRFIVDDWEEVCRENTDIERMHLQCGLQKQDTVSIIDVLCRNVLEDVSENDIVMFNPMGMAVFDMATAKYFYDKAIEKNVGVLLND